MTTLPVHAARQRAVNIVPQSDIPTLSPSHLDSLRGSGISDDIIRERGYRTVARQSDLIALGFSERQAATAKNGHVLVIPLHGVDGGICGYIARPDSPRIDPKSGKPRKYELPPKSRQILDVPPGCRDKISDPSIPLFITEGAKKADAAVSAGLTCIDLAGVWNWRGTNKVGGTTALPDWESIALNDDRQVYIVFDSDVTIKPGVWLAASRLGAVLRSKHAHVSYIILPALNNGNKCGLDDWLAENNNDTNALLQLACQALPPNPHNLGLGDDGKHQILFEVNDESGHWIARDDGIWIEVETNDPIDGTISTLQPLANFTARIVASVTRNDGAETHHHERIEWRLGSHVSVVDAEAIDLLEHPDRVAREALGPGAIIPFKIPPRRLGEAISRFSSLSPIQELMIYTHLGWEYIDKKPVYLSAGATIGAHGVVDGLAAEPPPALCGFKLPPPPDNPILAIRSVLKLLEIAPDRIMVPLLGAVWRAPIGDVDWALALSGHTGVRKSTLAALAQSFWVPDARYDHLPSSFMATANSIADLEFLAADALLVVDEYTPRGSDGEQARYGATAERILRGASNHAGRTRMRADGSIKPDRPPKSLVLVTGESEIEGESLRARTIMIEVEGGDVPTGAALSACQQCAQAGTYTQAMSAWIQYIAYATPAQMRQRLREFPNLIGNAGHDRSRRNLNDVASVWLEWLTWAARVGGISSEERIALSERVIVAITELAKTQERQIAEASVGERFVRLLLSSLNAGQAGITPLGTITSQVQTWATALEHAKPSVGWVAGHELWLDPGAATAVVKEQARKEGQPLAASPRSIAADLHRARLFLDVDPRQYSVRRSVFGRRSRVWVLAVSALVGEESPGNT